MKTIIRNFLSALRRFKMATLLNVLGLSIAFAAFIIIFMQLDYDWNFNKSHTDHACIYRVEATYDGGAQAIISRPLADAFIRSSPHIVAGTLTNPWNNKMHITIEDGGGEHIYAEPSLKVYPEFVDVFELDMYEGDKNAMQEPYKTLIPLSLSKKLFGDEPAVNKQFKAYGTNYTIGGVYRDFPVNTMFHNSIFYPIHKDENLNSWGNSNYELYIKVDAPANSEHLAGDFKRGFDMSAIEHGSEDWVNINLRLTPLTEVHFTTDTIYDSAPKASKQMLLVLFAIAIVIIVIAAINFTNFSTALTPIRIKGINTQKILGADERMLRLSLLMEAVIVSVISYFLALAWVFLLSLTSFVSLMNVDWSLASHLPLAVATALIAFCTGVLAGLYPSYYTTSFSPALVLKGSFGLSPKGRKLRNALIGIQFIASFALIIGSLFMYLQNHYMKNTPLGYEKDALIVTNLNGTLRKSREALVNQLTSFSGIEDVTYAEMLLSSSDQYMGWGRKFRDKNVQYQCLPVDASFLKVMGVEISEGRDFRKEDENTRRGAYVFNEKARSVYGFELGDRIDSAEIVGFMPDVKFASFRTEVVPMAFFVWGTQNWGNEANFAYIKVKAGSDLREAMKHTRNTIRSFDSAFPFNIRFFDEVLNDLYEKEQKTTALITLFSLLAVFISIVGVFGLVVFESEYRKKEVGLRKILGSTTGEILVMFNKIYIRILCVCFVVAAPVAYYAIRKWLENFAYKTPLYWWVFMVAFLLVAVITILTVTFQNWKSANTNPVESIKTE